MSFLHPHSLTHTQSLPHSPTLTPPPDPVDPLEAVLPFLSILQAHNMAGPFKLASLNAIQSFVRLDTLLDMAALSPRKVADALNQVVDGVTSCKFVQTDAAGDEMVRMCMVQTLRELVVNSCRMLLSDETVWKILQFCCSMMLSIGNTHP
jgi:hypothetical protein